MTKIKNWTYEDVMLGTKLRCTNDKGFSHWTTGKVYTVKYGTMNNYVEADEGTEIPVRGMLSRLNKEHKCSAEFEIIKEEEQMQYTEKDLKEGMKLRCTDDGGFDWWTKGYIYRVANKCIIDDFGDSAESGYILDSLNNERSPVKFEIFEYPITTITVDIEQQLNDRIELLHKERMNIIDKMERMEAQRCKLRDKIQKLSEAKEALKILKEFK